MKGINRTPWRYEDRAWVAVTASCGMIVGLESSLIFTSMREAQLRTSGVPVGPFC